MGETIKGTTISGFDYEIDKDATDDYDLLIALRKMDDDGSFWQIDKCLEILFGKEQKEAYLEYLRKKDGRAKTTVIGDDLGGVFSEDGLKNS